MLSLSRWKAASGLVLFFVLFLADRTAHAALAGDATLTIGSTQPNAEGAAPLQTPPPDRDRPAKDDGVDRAPLRLGALGGVGFPRPLSVEAMLKIGGYVGLGVEYGVMPTISISGVDTSLWSLAGDLRVFPFRGAFFVGVTAGFKHVEGSGSVTAAGVTLPSEYAALDSWYVSPKIGFLWTVKYGFTFGIDAGVELPIASTFSTSLPGFMASAVQSSGVVQTLSGPLPAIDLLRLGFLF